MKLQEKKQIEFNHSKDFPLLQRYPSLCYLDSSSTTQKPQCVIDAISNFYETSNANAHRGVYKISSMASDRLEESRSIVANFIGANSDEEIIFTKGTTESINLVANSYVKSILEPGDTILLGGAEHHANIVPWQIIAQSRGAQINYINILDSGELDLDNYKEQLGTNPKFISIAHTSNVLGTVNDIKKIVSLAKEKKIPIMVDGAQSISHSIINVKEIDCDFFAFSGHKVYGPMGVGVLYVSARMIDGMSPFMTGGGMIDEVGLQSSTYLDLPAKFEAGTQSIADIFALGEAIKYINNIGLDQIFAHEQNLTNYALEKLLEIEELSLIGPQRNRQAPIFSFNFDKIHPHDLATILDEKDIAVRAGHHCSQHAMKRFDVNSTVRASFGIYNTIDDVDKLIAGLLFAKSFFYRN